MILRVLSVLLVVQLALTTALYWPKEQHTGARASLIGGSIGDVESLQVNETASEGSLLKRAAGSNDWKLESELPADGDKAEQLLSALMEQDPGFPIATSIGARKRFAVAEDAYERKIQVAGSFGETVVYLGSSPSFRKIHARVADAEEIYVLELNSFDAPAGESQWLDQQLLAIKDVQDLTVDGTAFDQLDGQWRAAMNQELSEEADNSAEETVKTETVASEALEQLMTGLENFRVTGLASDEEATSPGTDVLVIEGNANSTGAGQRFEYTLIHETEQDRYFVRSSAYPQLFNTSAYDAERLLEAADTLLGRGSEETETSPSEEPISSLSSMEETRSK